MKYEVEVIKTVTQVFRATVTVEAVDEDEAYELGEDMASTLSTDDWGPDQAEDSPFNMTFVADSVEAQP